MTKEWGKAIAKTLSQENFCKDYHKDVKWFLEKWFEFEEKDMCSGYGLVRYKRH